MRDVIGAGGMGQGGGAGGMRQGGAAGGLEQRGGGADPMEQGGAWPWENAEAEDRFWSIVYSECSHFKCLLVDSSSLLVGSCFTSLLFWITLWTILF